MAKTPGSPSSADGFPANFGRPWASTASLEKKPERGDKLTVSGVIEDAQGKGVKEVEIELLLNGRKVPAQGQDERLGSGGQGAFVGRYRLPRGALPEAPIRIRAVKPGWQIMASWGGSGRAGFAKRVRV